MASFPAKKGQQGHRKDCPDIAPQIRRAFVRAVKRNGGGSYITDLMEKSLDKDFIGTLNALAKFNPKTSNVNQTNTLQINVDASVTGWVEGFQAGSKAEALTHQPVATLEHADERALEPSSSTNAMEPTLPYTFDLEEAEEAPVARPAKKPDYPPIAQADPADLAKMRSR